jgi:DNA primase
VLLGEGLVVAVVDLPAGEDPDTLVRRGGIEGWDEARRRAADPVEFIQRHVLRAGGAGDPRERALQAVVTLGVEIRDLIRRRLLLERASQVFGLSESVLVRAVALRSQGQDGSRPVQAAVTQLRHGEQFLERKLLQLVVHRPEALAGVRSRLSPADFSDAPAAGLAEWLWSGHEGLPAEEPAAAFARELVASAPEVTDLEQEIELVVRRMIERRLRRQMKERKQLLDKTTVEAEALRLMQEIEEIARSLRDLTP